MPQRCIQLRCTDGKLERAVLADKERSRDPLWVEVLWFISLFPFDIATNGGFVAQPDDHRREWRPLPLAGPAQ